MLAAPLLPMPERPLAHLCLAPVRVLGSAVPASANKRRDEGTGSSLEECLLAGSHEWFSVSHVPGARMPVYALGRQSHMGMGSCPTDSNSNSSSHLTDVGHDLPLQYWAAVIGRGPALRRCWSSLEC